MKKTSVFVCVLLVFGLISNLRAAEVCEDGTHIVTGTGEMIGRTSSAVNSTYVYSGSAVMNESTNELEFCYNQTAKNAMGSAVYKITGSFDLDTWEGTSTVESCDGPALMCAGVDPIIGISAEYIAANGDASDPADITWEVNFEQEIAGMGWADSASTLAAIICTDADTDEYYAESGCGTEVDCDDNDASINPGAEEIPFDLNNFNTIDENCDGKLCFISILR